MDKISRGVNPNRIHFSELSLWNFKGFRSHLSIPLAPITFLVGPNSSGKSSLFSSLLLISQSNFSIIDYKHQSPNWAGPLIDLGSYKDVVYKHINTYPIRISLKFASPLFAKVANTDPNNTQISIRYEFKTRNADDMIGYLSSVELTDDLSGESIEIEYMTNKLRIKYSNNTHEVKYSKGEDYHSPRPNIEVFLALQDKYPYLKNAPIGRKAARKRLLHALILEYTPIFKQIQRVSSGRAAPRRWYSIAEMSSQRSYSIFNRVLNDVNPRMISRAKNLKYTYWGYTFHEDLMKSYIQTDLTLNKALEKLDIASRAMIDCLHIMPQLR